MLLSLVALMLSILHFLLWIKNWIHLEDRGKILTLFQDRMHFYITLQQLHRQVPLKHWSIWNLTTSSFFWGTEVHSYFYLQCCRVPAPLNFWYKDCIVPGARKTSWCNWGVILLLWHLLPTVTQVRWHSTVYLDAIKPKLLQKTCKFC